MDTMDTLRNEFKISVLNYLDNVNYNNFGKSYDGLVSIIHSYKERNLSKNDVIQVIVEIAGMELDENKEEVIGEISSRLHGFCSPSLEIDW